MAPGRLYVVATPIGNLEDVTLRGLRVLREADRIAAEDTRRVSRLLNRYGISTPVTSYHDFSTPAKRRRLLERIQRGEEVALVSDAGTPAVADPGYRLITEALDRGIPVTAVPGPSVVTAALCVAGLPTDAFYFGGFLPRRAAARRRRLAELAGRPETLVLYETPHRLRACLEEMAEILGDRRLAVARELTKLHEEVFRGRIREAAEHFAAAPRVRGEITLVVEGAPAAAEPVPASEAARAVRDLMEGEGLSRTEAARRVAAARGLPKGRVYRWSLDR